MRKIIPFILTGVLILGMLTGCGSNSGNNNAVDSSAEEITSSEKQPAEKPTVSSTETPKENANPSAEPASDVTSKPDDVSQTGNAEVPENPDNVSQTGNAEVPENPDDDAEQIKHQWDNTVDVFMSFINGQINAEGLEKLCAYFSESETYSLKDITCAYAGYMSDENGGVILSLSDISYGFIKRATADKPILAINLVYESGYEYDESHNEKLIFGENEGKVEFITNISTYYRSQGDLNDCGYYRYIGSAGANLGSSSYYYIDEKNENRFVYALDEVFGLAELRIPDYMLPSDANSLFSTEVGDEYSDPGYTLEIFCFEKYNEDIYPEYGDYQRSAYYTFSDFEGNPVIPESEYIDKCKSEGINIVSYDEIEKLIDKRYSELGIDEACVSAPVFSDYKELKVEDYRDDSSTIGENPDELAGDIAEGYMSFLKGDVKASSLGLLCNRFTENGQYTLKKIVESYEEFLEERDSVTLEFTDMSYAFIENELKGKPYMVLRITYEAPDRMDAPYIENMIFDYDGYGCNFLANYETGESTYVNIGKKGMIALTGNRNSCDYSVDLYYIDSYDDKYNVERFLFSTDYFFGYSEATIPAEALPTDSFLKEEASVENFNGNLVLLRYSFRKLSDEDDETWYNHLLRECSYIFYDEEDNEIVPDEEYIGKCADDGISIITEAEIMAKRDSVFAEYGVTDESVSAPFMDDSEFIHYDFRQ